MGVQSLCAMCRLPGTLACGGWKSIKYSSATCQKGDWPVHKLICKTFQDFLTTRPTSEHHSAIYFPADEDTPRFVWLKYSNCEQHVPYEELQSLGLSLKWIKQSTQIEVSHNAAHPERTRPGSPPHRATSPVRKDEVKTSLQAERGSSQDRQ